jgi:predicted anti-sigma-YlaC factor YlaD
MSEALIKLWTPIVLNAQVAAAEHVRDCASCRHLFEVAFDEAELSDQVVYSEMVVGPSPFFVMTQILRELRSCPEWPKNI